MSNNEKDEKLKGLSDLEYEIAYIDGISKKFNKLTGVDIRTSTALFLIMSCIETLKKYKSTAKDDERTIPHEDTVDLIIKRGEDYLASVADNEDSAKYVSKVASYLYELSREFLFLLKRELVETDEYKHLSKSNEVLCNQ